MSLDTFWYISFMYAIERKFLYMRAVIVVHCTELLSELFAYENTSIHNGNFSAPVQSFDFMLKWSLS